MRKRILITLSTLLLTQTLTVIAAPNTVKADLAAPETSTVPKGLVERFSLQQLKRIIQDEGYGSVEVREGKFITFKSDGRTFILNLYKDGDLQLYYGATGIIISAKDLNEWNRTKRLSRAYLDTDQDVALESDLFANAGLTQKSVTEMIRIFVNVSTPQFVDFVRNHDQTRT